MYPAMTYIGSNKFSALYGQHDTIIDQKATGLQHLFIDQYNKDYIHTACNIVKVEDTLYYADRVKPKIGHPRRVQAKKSYVIGHSIMVDAFSYPGFDKTDYVAAGDDYILFKTVIKNTSDSNKTFKVGGILITQTDIHLKAHYQEGLICFTDGEKHFGIKGITQDSLHASLDAPSGFMYKGFEDFLYGSHLVHNHLIESDQPIASSLGKHIMLSKDESYSFLWVLKIKDSKESLIESLKTFDFSNDFDQIKSYWEHYLSNIKLPVHSPDVVKTKLVALKGALLDGLLPADLTGHYFANNKVSFYSRDALMGSRAFLYAGLYEDFKSVIDFFLACELKENGEYYQRYRYDKIGDEGANNNVFKQIDFIGYFCRVIQDYALLTNELLCDFKTLDRLISILETIEQKNGLYGPEGGVNEGVYGPAYIVSTNMFIAGGLKGAIALALKHHQIDYVKKWQPIYFELIHAIESSFLDEGYFPYGYVTYHNDIIKRYDTPQLFSASLGYPLTQSYRKNFTTLLNHATYYDFGFGYSEQEYHDGPWLFNTATAAQTAYRFDMNETYESIMQWMLSHQNGFLMNPEAVDAKNPLIPFINPLMWANAEFVCAAYMNEIESLRRDEDDFLKNH